MSVISDYAATFIRIMLGVEALAVRCDITLEDVRLTTIVPVDEPGLVVFLQKAARKRNGNPW